VIVQQTPDAHVLLHTGTGQYYSLDELGGRIWQLCDGSRRIADIVAVLCDEYDAPRSEIETDAMALVGELAEERLLSTP
jgi:pyrroloquinoline quinone biosynthesis protein D